METLNRKNETSFYYGKTDNVIITYVAIDDNTYISVDRDAKTNSVCAMKFFTSHNLVMQDIKERLNLKDYMVPEFKANIEDKLYNKINSLTAEIDILDSHYKKIFEDKNNLSKQTTSIFSNDTYKTSVAKVVNDESITDKKPSQEAMDKHFKKCLQTYIDNNTVFSNTNMLSGYVLYENFLKEIKDQKFDSKYTSIEYFINTLKEVLSNPENKIISKGDEKYIKYMITNMKITKNKKSGINSSVINDESKKKSRKSRTFINYTELQTRINEILSDGKSMSISKLATKLDIAYPTLCLAVRNGKIKINGRN